MKLTLCLEAKTRDEEGGEFRQVAVRTAGDVGGSICIGRADLDSLAPDLVVGESVEVRVELVKPGCICPSAGVMVREDCPAHPCGRCGGSGTDPGDYDGPKPCQRCGGTG